MKTYPVRPGSTVTAYALKRSPSSRWRPTVRAFSRVRTIERPFLRARCRERAISIHAMAWRDGIGEGLQVDNREIATILRGAIMDLVVAFQTIERQIHAAPERHATSNHS